jgi:hypothetical protein
MTVFSAFLALLQIELVVLHLSGVAINSFLLGAPGLLMSILFLIKYVEVKGGC